MGVAGALWFGGLVSGLGVEPAYAAKPGSTTPTVSISEFRSLEFGTVAGSADGSSTLVMSPSGVLTATGYGVVIKGTIRAGEYKISGPAGANVLITLPTTATLSSATSSATLSNFTSSPAAGVATLDNKGNLVLNVGATLNLPAGQAGGDYTGTFVIFVDLQ